MHAKRVFISMPGVTDPAHHRAYNQWHQMDHFPENRALDAVEAGDRWVYSPRCQAVGQHAPFLEAAQYLTMYWFREPLDRHIAEWRDFGETALYGGRRSDLPFTTRTLLGFFKPVMSYVSPRVQVSAAAVPHRPHRGVYIDLLHVPSPTDPTVDPALKFHDTDGLAQTMALNGAVGYWSFISESLVLPKGVQLAQPEKLPAGVPDDGRRMPKVLARVFWVESDPVDFAQRLEELRTRWPAEARPSSIVSLFSGPLETVTPWQWDWFDSPAETPGSLG